MFSTPISILLGNLTCKEGIKVDMEKIKIILDLKPPTNTKEITSLLGHTGYYINIIMHYFDITFSLDELLKNEA